MFFQTQTAQTKVVYLGDVDATNVPYRLQVVTTMHRKNIDNFRNNADKLKKVVEDAGLKLLLSSWDADVQSDDIVTVAHYWAIEDANALVKVDLILLDNPDYAPFYQLIDTEVKDFAVPIVPPNGMLGLRQLPASSKNYHAVSSNYQYVRVAIWVEPQRASEFCARMESGMVPFAEAQGWGFGVGYLSFTGRLGNVVQMWRVPKDATISTRLNDILSTKAPWLEKVQLNNDGTLNGSGVIRQFHYRIFDPTPIDPDPNRFLF
jgi:hypothetical protein